MGRLFKKGQSGNPGGLTKEQREIRQSVSEKLNARFEEGGVDRLVDAIVFGVERGDASCIKLACEYRWGKPSQELTGPNGGPLQVEASVNIYLPDNGRDK